MADTEFTRSSCYGAAAAAAKAAGAELSDRDLAAAFRAATEERERLRAAGITDNVAERIKSAVEATAERTRIAAALLKKQAALNILVRDRLNQTVEAFKSAGMSPSNAILAIMEGSQQGIKGARDSVFARRLGYEARYVGGMMSEIQKDRPHLIHTLTDKRLSDDVFREMGELREGGKPGVTGNQDAKYLADVFAKHVETSRTELNRLGASIGKLDGWAGAQVHDDLKMIAAGKESWIDKIAPYLDLNRTFPDASSAEDVKKILGDMYDTIITGVPNKATAKEMGQRVNPANLAKSLGKTRVLHFKDAENAIAYRDAFGYGNSIYGIMAHQRRAASMAAQMDAFGPNPEIMFNSLVESERRKLRDDQSLDPEAKVKAIQKLNAEAGPLKGAFDVMSGAISRPGNVTGAKVGNDIRAVQSMAKLGSAVLTAMPTDVVGAASASMFRGEGFFNGMQKQISGIFHGRPKEEQAEISYLFGEGFDSMVGEIVSHGLANDGPVGKMSKLTEQFFKWSGLNWWTDVGRSVVGRTVAAEMGMRAEKAYADLPANYQHVLGLHGIDEAKWDILRQAQRREVNGNSYITPDAIQNLPDEAVGPLVKDRVALENKSLADRQSKRSADDDRERQWVESRKQKLDEWSKNADDRISKIMSERATRTEAQTNLLLQKVELEKAKIEAARNDVDILESVRGGADKETLNKLFDTEGNGLAARTDKIIEAVGARSGKSGETLGARRQRLTSQITSAEKEIKAIEARRVGRLSDVDQRADKEFNERVAALDTYTAKAEKKIAKLGGVEGDADKEAIVQSVRDDLSAREYEFHGWVADAQKSLENARGGDEVHSGIETELMQRRADLLSTKIQQIENEHDLYGSLGAIRDQKRLRDVISKTGDKADALLTRRASSSFRRGESMGAYRQRALGRIRDLETSIAKMEKGSAKTDAALLKRDNELFQSRMKELNEFSDKSFSREQARADAAARDDASHPERLAEIHDDGRRQLQLSLLKFVADETNYAIVETDAASRRISTLGTRPGTIAGEAARFVMQFKGFPIAFSQRVLGRALFGGRGATKYERIMNNAPHIGALIGGMTVAGYMAMTMKDAAKGYWPPRNPLDPKVMTAALTQGGALGIYGDFLFGQANRFGSGALETFSGPTIGTMSDLINIPLKARTALTAGKKPQLAGDVLNLTLQNAPWLNLSYVRPALDVLFLNSLRNWASPGYVNRQQRGRLKDYGQRPLWPSTLGSLQR